MTSRRPALDPRSRAAQQQAHRQQLFAQATEESAAWHGASSLMSGVLLLGVVGWLLGRWSGWPWPLPVGIVLGAALGLVPVWFRYGVDRSAHDERAVR